MLLITEILNGLKGMSRDAVLRGDRTKPETGQPGPDNNKLLLLTRVDVMRSASGSRPPVLYSR